MRANTGADGNHHSFMIAFEDGKDATVHFYVYRGQLELFQHALAKLGHHNAS
jgi:hypothetical protein